MEWLQSDQAAPDEAGAVRRIAAASCNRLILSGGTSDKLCVYGSHSQETGAETPADSDRFTLRPAVSTPPRSRLTVR